MSYTFTFVHVFLLLIDALYQNIPKFVVLYIYICICICMCVYFYVFAWIIVVVLCYIWINQKKNFLCEANVNMFEACTLSHFSYVIHIYICARFFIIDWCTVSEYTEICCIIHIHIHVCVCVCICMYLLYCCCIMLYMNKSKKKNLCEANVNMFEACTLSHFSYVMYIYICGRFFIIDWCTVSEYTEIIVLNIHIHVCVCVCIFMYVLELLLLHYVICE
jgi:hypothetical protein